MRRPLSLLLMLFLLLSQQATLSHAVSHWAPAALAAASGQEQASDTSTPAVHACELCAAAAQYAAALPASSPLLQSGPSRAVYVTSARSHTFRAATSLAFHSRAPPRA